jgi:hypothetical protein
MFQKSTTESGCIPLHPMDNLSNWDTSSNELFIFWMKCSHCTNVSHWSVHWMKCPSWINFPLDEVGYRPESSSPTFREWWVGSGNAIPLTPPLLDHIDGLVYVSVILYNYNLLLLKQNESNLDLQSHHHKNRDE